MADERDETIPGRRETDWQKPGFWLSVMGFLLVIALALLGAIWSKLDTLNTSMTAYAVSSKGQEKDINALQEFRRKQEAADDIRDTWSASTREKAIRMEQKLEDFGIIKPGELGPPLGKK